MFNKQYNTRNSGRYNTPGQFIPASNNEQQYTTPRKNFQNYQVSEQAAAVAPAVQQQNLQQVPIQESDVEMKGEIFSDGSVKQEDRPVWMKSKTAGVKKISNKERRRRQNRALRRLLTPKNALMILNEMKPNEQLANQFKVEAAPQNQNYFNKNVQSFCADLNLEGEIYKGYGENKLSARNSAAEQAIRDLIIKKMNKAVNSEGAEEGEEEALPMIQLASFALYKLFSEWEYEGHKVPQLRPGTLSTSEGGAPGEAVAAAAASGAAAGGAAAGGAAAGGAAPRERKPRVLPLNARAMHPCMLLTYMRPHLEYRDVPQSAAPHAHNTTFVMTVEVDGKTYEGKAGNKKEARKEAARAACRDLFGVVFDAAVTSNQPLLPS